MIKMSYQQKMKSIMLRYPHDQVCIFRTRATIQTMDESNREGETLGLRLIGRIRSFSLIGTFATKLKFLSYEKETN